LILCDAGPLVALIHASDKHHVICRDTFRSLSEPLVTVWPAFTEAMYLLAFSSQAQQALLAFVERGALDFLPLRADDSPRMGELMRKYQDLPMDFADAALVRVAERERLPRIFTVDRRDFSVYRPQGFGRFELLPTG
jgi:predicted nucleic acid-binding protein